MYRTCKKTFGILTAVVFGVFIISSLGCRSGCHKDEKINPLSLTFKEKFETVADWIPPSTNTILTLDITKISQTKYWDQLINNDPKSLIKNIEKIGLGIKTDVAMAVVLMEIESTNQIRGPVMLIYGGLQDGAILSRIKEYASGGDIKIAEQKYKNRKIYSEAEKDGVFGTPYAFASLGERLVAAAKSDDLKWIIDNKNNKLSALSHIVNYVNWEKPIWGKIIVPENLSKSLPPPWQSIGSVFLEADLKDDMNIAFTAILKKDEKTGPLIKTLEGFKAIEAIQMSEDKEMLKEIDKIKITGDANKVLVAIPADAQLINYFLSKRMKVEDETQDGKSVKKDKGL